MTPSWYDVLDVDESATPAEIRTAWKAAIADLDPGDRRFRLANQAAEVLLDPERRAAHDAALAAEAPSADVAAEDAVVADGAGADDGTVVAEDGADHEIVVVDEADEVDEPDEADEPDEPDQDEPAAEPADHPAPSRGPRTVAGLGTRVLALAVVAAVLVALTVVALVQGRDGSDADAATLPDDRSIEDARGSAEAAVVPVLEYDYRTLEEDRAEARSYLTDGFAAEYDKLFAAAIETNAVRTRTVVRATLLESAVVRTGEDRVDVLVFVNRRETNKQRTDNFYDQVTLRMLEVDGAWLVDCLLTSAEGRCESG